MIMIMIPIPGNLVLWLTLTLTSLNARKIPHSNSFSMISFVLFEILWTLESLAAKLALVGLERNMNTNVRLQVVPLTSGCTALVPCAGQVEVVG